MPKIGDWADVLYESTDWPQSHACDQMCFAAEDSGSLVNGTQNGKDQALELDRALQALRVTFEVTCSRNRVE